MSKEIKINKSNVNHTLKDRKKWIAEGIERAAGIVEVTDIGGCGDRNANLLRHHAAEVRKEPKPKWTKK